MMISRLAAVAGAAMTLFARPSEWTRTVRDASSTTPFADGSQHYFAFLSYSHRDQAMAEWLQDALEDFRVPSHLVGRVTEHGSVPRRLTPIFRDVQELPASGDLGHEIRAALAASRFLVVLCSPAAAESRWTNAEIETFKRLRPEGCVFAAIVDGEPFASEIRGREHEECLPRALRYKYDRRGRATAKRAEPLAADLRGDAQSRRRGFLKLIAGMLGLGLDDLVRRDDVRRHRHMAMVTAGSLAGMIVASGLAIAAIEARDSARDERREAEGLIGFMLGDLRSKLEPVGRLDALDGVGSKVLDYYKKQDMSDLTDAALLQRSRALTMMADVANSRGDLESSLRLYRAAMAGTAEAIRREPDDPQRLFDHAQNVFWTADIALRRGDAQGAEAAFREYKRLADRMVALEPDNMKWRMETQYADANLGIMLFDQRRYGEAARQFEAAMRTVEAIATADPTNDDYQKALPEALAWMADAHMAEGRLDLATAERERHVKLLEQRLRQSGGDVEYETMLVPAHRALGRLHAMRGRLNVAVRHAQEAASHASRLLKVESGNSKWLDFAARARLNLAEYLLALRMLSNAAGHADAGCSISQSLIAQDQSVAQWRALHRDCLITRANVAVASGAPAEALSHAARANEVARSVTTSDRTEDALFVAKTLRIVGDIQLLNGNRAAAGAAWRQALAALPRSVSERPPEMSERQLILQRVSRKAEARGLAAKLAAMGYREPEFRGL